MCMVEFGKTSYSAIEKCQGHQSECQVASVASQSETSDPNIFFIQGMHVHTHTQTHATKDISTHFQIKT